MHPDPISLTNLSHLDNGSLPGPLLLPQIALRRPCSDPWVCVRTPPDHGPLGPGPLLPPLPLWGGQDGELAHQRGAAVGLEAVFDGVSVFMLLGMIRVRIQNS